MSEQEFLAISEEARAIIDRIESLLKECADSHQAAMAELFKEAA